MDSRFSRALAQKVNRSLPVSRYTGISLLGTALNAVAAAERIRFFEPKTSPYDFVSTFTINV